LRFTVKRKLASMLFIALFLISAVAAIYLLLKP